MTRSRRAPRKPPRERPRPGPPDRSPRPAATPAPPVAASPKLLWACAAVVLVATFLAYAPVLGADFLSWDDESYVTNNPILRDVSGLAEIWNPFAKTPNQYYPTVFSLYWIEYQLWGPNGTAFHAVNLGLHLVNVVLCVWLTLGLGASAWVAVAAAAVFALNPVQVASVAWIAEGKNTLSCLFFLVTFLLYLHHRRTGRAEFYAAALGAFLLSVLSKTQTVGLPVAIFLADWLLQRSAGLPRLAPSAIAARVLPLLAVGVFPALVTVRVESETTPAWRLPGASERPLIAANAAWFYVAKFLAPVGLSPIYTRWSVTASDPRWWIGLAAWPVVLGALWRWWRRVPPLALWGMALFFVSAGPALGLLRFGFQQYSFVADHFLYVSCLGGGLALAVFAAALAGAGSSRRRALVTACGVAVLLGYAVQTRLETRHWRDTRAFWERVVARNPGSFPAHFSLANLHRKEKDWEEALVLYRRSFEIRPDSPGAFMGYAAAVGATGGAAAVKELCDAELAKNPRFLPAYLERARVNTSLGNRSEAARDYERVMEFTERDSEAWRLARSRLDRLGKTSR